MSNEGRQKEITKDSSRDGGGDGRGRGLGQRREKELREKN